MYLPVSYEYSRVWNEGDIGLRPMLPEITEMLVEQFYAFSPRDQVNMGMGYGLACDPATVYADVEPLHRGVVTHDLILEREQKLLRVETFLISHAEVVLGMTMGNDEQVTLSNRIEVFDGKDRSLLHQDAVSDFIGTEYAFRCKSQHDTPAKVLCIT